MSYTANSESVNRPNTRSQNKSKYTDDDIVIQHEFDKIITHSSEKTLRDKLTNLKDLFQTNTLEKQSQIDQCNTIATRLEPIIEKLSKELNEIKSKYNNTESEKDYLKKEAEEQINKLSEENTTQKITIDNQKKQLEYLKLLIEEKEGSIKQQLLEIEGLNLTIETMKNTLEKKTNYNCINYYSTTGYNSSFDVSSILENGNIQDSSIMEFDTQHNTSPFNSSNKKDKSINQTSSTINTIVPSTKSPSKDIIKNTSKIQCEANSSEPPQQYLTPNIVILNNKSQQQDLEAQGFINKQPIIKNTPFNKFSSVESLTLNKSPSPKRISEQHVLKSYLDEINTNMNAKLSDMNKNISKIISKIHEMEKEKPKQTKRNSISEPNCALTSDSNSQIPILKEKVDVLIIGDHHANQIKPSLTKTLPQELTIKDHILNDGDFPKLSVTKVSTTCSHLIIMAGTHDIQKTPMYEIKEAIDKIIYKHKNSYIHFVQIPERFDNINLNYHINQVNRALQFHLKGHKNSSNISIYKTNEIIDNWDYNENVKINQNGMYKLCEQIKREIAINTSRKQSTQNNQQKIFVNQPYRRNKTQHQPKFSKGNYKQRNTDGNNKLSWNPLPYRVRQQHPVFTSTRHPEPEQKSHYSYNYDDGFPIQGQHKQHYPGSMKETSQQIIFRPFTRNHFL